MLYNVSSCLHLTLYCYAQRATGSKFAKCSQSEAGFKTYINVFKPRDMCFFLFMI